MKRKRSNIFKKGDEDQSIYGEGINRHLADNKFNELGYFVAMNSLITLSILIMRKYKLILQYLHLKYRVYLAIFIFDP